MNTFNKMILPSIGLLVIYLIYDMFKKGVISGFMFSGMDFIFYVVICGLLLYSISTNPRNSIFSGKSDDYQLIDDQYQNFNKYYLASGGLKSDLDKLVSRTERKDFISNDKSRVIDCIEMLFQTKDGGHCLIVYDITNGKIRRNMTDPPVLYQQVPFYNFDIENYKRRPYDYKDRGGGTGTMINIGSEKKDMDKEALGKKEGDDDRTGDRPQSITHH